MWTKLRFKTQGIQTPGGTYMAECLLPGSHSEDGEKSPCSSGRRRGKVAFLENAQGRLFFLRPASRATILPEPSQVQFCQSLTSLEKGNSQF